ncbi:ATP-dependent helicase [Candidatus Woesearchaeota archaeon]|nr:ATP-dependent helicase [Candidatus Woesearchaeota archaeon]
MITLLEKPDREEDILKIFHPCIKEWFIKKFNKFSEPQKYSILNIHNQKNILISSPTGSGKTLTAFLSILNELIILSENNILEDKVYAVYISPLKALSNDIEFNLKQPLKEIEEIADKKFYIRVAVRTGDTSVSKKQSMLKKPPHIIVTTPESLSIMLTSIKFKDLIKDAKYLIVDEIHALAENKRGSHLSLSLEILQHLKGKEELTRIGLSATISPLEEIARFLVGNNRPCRIADISFNKKMDLKVLSPVKDLINTTYEETSRETYNLLNKLIQDHKTTLIFTNTRSATERVVHNLKEKFPKLYNENIAAHHGSLDKEHRLNTEKRMRNGELNCIVCSTSLELGIDIGYIDLVILLGSPKSISRALQRIGRAGHKLHDTIKGRIITLDRDDLVENSVLLKNVIERKIDRIHIPKKPLDVMAQQIYAISIISRFNTKDLFSLIKRSYIYKDLELKEFNETLDYLSGEYTSLEDRHVYAKIWHDKETNMIGKRGKMARVIYMTNSGTIPEESMIKVKIANQVIGTIDEAFLERLKPGDVFVLGGSTYTFRYSRGQTAQVSSSADRPPTVPSWFSEMLPLSFDLALEIGKFRHLMSQKMSKPKKEILDFINEYLYIDEYGAEAICSYFNEQYLFIKEIPTNKKIIIEHYSSEDDNKVIFHSLFGRRINDCLSRAMAYAIYRLQHKDVEIGINDNGFYISGKKVQAVQAFNLINSKDLRKILDLAINSSEILKRKFRHCAVRSLMILRSYKGKNKRVGRQQISSMLLINAVKRISEDFPILKEARREVLEDNMDINNLKLILEKIEKKEIEIKEIYTQIPSPFAFNIALQGRTDMLRMEDRVKFLRNMHNLVLAKISLK